MTDIGVNPGGLGCHDPLRIWAVGGRRAGRGGSRTGHETLLYLIIYRKYVRKWWLFKRNRI